MYFDEFSKTIKKMYGNKFSDDAINTLYYEIGDNSTVSDCLDITYNEWSLSEIKNEFCIDGYAENILIYLKEYTDAWLLDNDKILFVTF